jgi:hypothetical protein
MAKAVEGAGVAHGGVSARGARVARDAIRARRQIGILGRAGRVTTAGL